jgi:hypothetical protein
VTYLVQPTKRLLSLAWPWMCTHPNNDTLHAASLAGGNITEGSLIRKKEKETKRTHREAGWWLLGRNRREKIRSE